MKTDEISLISALQKQMFFCETYKNYRCGVFTTSQIERQQVMSIISNLLPIPNHDIELRANACNSIVRFKNGSYIKLVHASDGARGHKFNGLIVSTSVSEDIYLNILRPMVLPIVDESTGMFDKGDNPYNRVYDCAITQKEVDASEEIKRYNMAMYMVKKTAGSYFKKTQPNDLLDAMSYSIKFCNNNYIKFKKEYEEMYNEYDRPIIDKEVDGKRYLLYEAWGIPKSAITHKTEFVNKTKDMYLNVNGKAEDEYLDFENDINIHLPINTDVYDSFEVSVNDGMVRIVLHEIKNEEPELKDLSIGI